MLYRLDRRPVILLACFALLSVPFTPAELWLVKTLVDRIGAWTPQLPIGPIVEGAAWLALIMAMNNIGFGVPIPMAQTRLMEIGRVEEQRLIMDKTAKLPLKDVEAPGIKDARERALRLSLDGIYITGIGLVQSTLHLAALSAILLAFGQWIPLAAVFASALLLTLVSGKSAEGLERLSRKQAPDRRLLRHYADLMTKRDAAKEIRLFGLGRLLSARWTALFERQSLETWQAVRSAELRKVGPELLLALLGGLLLALLVLLPGANRLSAGDFTLLFMALTMLLSQLTGWIQHGVSLRQQYMRWEDFQAYMALEEDGDRERFSRQPSARAETAAADSQTVPFAVRITAPPVRVRATWSDRLQEDADDSALHGAFRSLHLQVSDLRFRYPDAAQDTLNGLTLTIPPGCHAALVGENGSGKSTLVKLLTGLYAPCEGAVEWSDGEGNRLPMEAARANASAVFQDFTRLYLTLRENVALGNLALLEEDAVLRETLKSAGSRLRDLDAQLGAPFGGLEPSGGEWQKIVTARTLLRGAGFVFFDEPTAALDPEAEKEAFDLFLRVTKGRSALLVTHRLGAAKLADVIFVLKQGRLVEQGTHRELMNSGGEYSRMFRLQASWYV